ncbi:cell division protein FtsX [Limimaricola pyoseonensis]|uniref:Cell division transport system permease protein n=1 Tax=Limimaricola pyoseonensis TaxID=521013 RepID=A0A1G7JYM8_9RHOB|nr:cell division protein FtsX [Limimaricola pyoseonensis]SDF30010.1 cell division transport system permease protein [Limimaricola pyoseonensis]
MSRLLAQILDLLAGDVQADRTVPPTGFTARLTIFTAAAMALLAVFALAFSLSTGRLAERWSEELARTATLRISAPPEQMAAQRRAALELLATTPGIAEARALDAEETQALLTPWFGPDLPLEQLPIPQLIEIVEDRPGYDATGLRARLQAEVPGAVLDDHTRWREPLVAAAARLRLLGWLAMALIGGAMAAMITLAAQSALSANAQVIRVLRLIGARDAYIARAFVRRFTLRALWGAASGTTLGAAILLVLPGGAADAGFLGGFGLAGGQWLWLLPIPPLAAAVAFTATRAAARRTLERQS